MGYYPLTRRTVTNLAQHKPHILKAKGGAWHVAAEWTVPRELIRAAVKYRNEFLEKEMMAKWCKSQGSTWSEVLKRR